MGALRVCQLITELWPGGAERHVFELARRVDGERFDVQVAALRGGEVADWLREAGVKTTVLGMLGKWDITRLRPLAGLLRRQRIDILHTHLFHADVAGRAAAAMASVPHLVHTVHTAERRFRPWHFAFARFFSDRCERIICVSDSVRRHHSRRSGLPRRCYQVIPNGVDVEAFAHDPVRRAELRGQWGIGPDQPLAAFVGRLADEKGLETLLGAMSHLAARGKPMHLVLAGDGPRRRVVENFIAHGEGGGHCRMLGFVRDVRGVLSAADMLIMPSRWEGFGLAAAEAMAASLPVIASRVPGLQDVVVDGQTALTAPAGDVVAFAEAVELLGGDADLRRRLGQAGQERAAQCFNIQTTIAAHEKLYLDVAGAGVSP
jgi:glycosyltransferase involved in cell wall biosynthesis